MNSEKMISREVNKIINQISYTLNQIMWIIWKNEDQMYTAIKSEIEYFCEQIYSEYQVLKWTILHKNFLRKIQEIVKFFINNKLHPIIEVVPQLCQHIDSFIEITKQAFRSNENVWWHHREKNIQLYQEKLNKLGIVKFLDSIQ